MKNYNIKQIEELVEKIGDCYDYPEEELVKQMNLLTGNDWDAQTYWEYTCEYWSHHSLEQTVYALIKGQYPPEKENKYYVWSAKFPLKEIMSDVVDSESNNFNILEKTYRFFQLGKYRNDREKFERFNVLPLDEIYKWFQDTFAGWECRIFEHADKDRGSLSFSTNIEYGIDRDILVFPYEEKCLGITFTNVEEKDIEKVFEFLKPYVTDIVKQ